MWRASGSGLVVVSGYVSKRIINAAAIDCWCVYESVEIFFIIDRLEKCASVALCLGVFYENSRCTMDPPHTPTRPQKSAIGIKLFQASHGMETIDRDPILTVKAVICYIANTSPV
jgi:hypothetical protein